jgi:tRNA-splicing ligase RtcB
MKDILKARQNVPVKLWIPANEAESDALDQLKNVADLPYTFKHVAGMPDIHTGKGATVGSVVAMKGAICPCIVGVDIGCGMDAMKTTLERGQLSTRKLIEIRDAILERIPVGFNEHKSVHRDIKMLTSLWKSFEEIEASELKALQGKAMSQLGSLGGGNHFIELSYDENDSVWIVLHSGSRNIGKCIADYHTKVAMAQQHNQTNLPDKALSSLLEGTKEFDSYFHDMIWAQEYAYRNRTRMLDLIIGYLEHIFKPDLVTEHIACHHNFTQKETHFDEQVYVTRKGAIEAKVGQKGIIPGSMGNKSYIVEGLGNPEAFCSAPHGAGRKMSRGKAKAKYTFDDLKASMEGIVNNATKSTVDEIGNAYKSISKVMEYASDLVVQRHELVQLLNIKG